MHTSAKFRGREFFSTGIVHRICAAWTFVRMIDGKVKDLTESFLRAAYEFLALLQKRTKYTTDVLIIKLFGAMNKLRSLQCLWTEEPSTPLRLSMVVFQLSYSNGVITTTIYLVLHVVKLVLFFMSWKLELCLSFFLKAAGYERKDEEVWDRYLVDI